MTRDGWWLLGLGALGAAVWGLAFLVPYPLVAHVATPLLDLGKLAGYQEGAAVAFILAFAALFGCYLGALAIARALRGRAATLVPLGGALLQSLVLLLVYPVGAADLFDYLLHARVWLLHSANPLLVPPAAFPDDPLLPYVAWPHAPSAYGPLWLALSAPAVPLGGDDLLAGLLVLKLVVLIGFFGALGALAAALPAERRAWGLVLVGWNPLAQFELAANGHNDSWLALFLVLAALAYRRRAAIGTGLALAAGGLVKFLTYPLLPLFLAVELRRRGALSAALAALAAGALVALAYLPFFEPGDLLGLERRRELFTASLPRLAVGWLTPELGEVEAQRLVATAASGLFAGATLLATSWVGLRGGSPLRAAFELLFGYLLLCCLWFQPWYVTWLLPLAALLPSGWLVARTLAYSASAAVANYVVFVFLWVWNWDMVSVQTVQAWAALGIHGPPALVTAASVAAGLWRVLGRGVGRRTCAAGRQRRSAGRVGLGGAERPASGPLGQR